MTKQIQNDYATNRISLKVNLGVNGIFFFLNKIKVYIQNVKYPSIHIFGFGCTLNETYPRKLINKQMFNTLKKKKMKVADIIIIWNLLIYETVFN